MDRDPPRQPHSGEEYVRVSLRRGARAAMPPKPQKAGRPSKAGAKARDCSLCAKESKDSPV